MSAVSRPCIDGERHDWLLNDGRTCRRCKGSKRTESDSCFYAFSYSTSWGCLGSVKDDATVRYVAREASRGNRTWRASCDLCQVGFLRRLSKVERGPVIERLKEDEDEVLALYGRPATDRWLHRSIATPQLWRERYQTWRLAKEHRQETRRQRAALRQGHQTLTAIRSALRHGAVPSLPPESRPARTSPTS
jgi:hypothetical protein